MYMIAKRGYREKETKMLQRRALLCLLSLCVYFIWLVFSISKGIAEGFEATLVLPAVFIMVFFALLWEPIIRGRGPFVVTYTVVAMMRFIVLSAVTIIAVSDQGQFVFGKNVYSSDQLNTAAILMSYELIVTAVAIYVLRERGDAQSRRSITYGFNSPVYLGVIIIAVAAVLVLPEARSGLTILMNYDEEGTSGLSTSILLVRELFVTAKYLLFFVVIKWVCKRDANGKIVQNPTSVVILCLVSLIVIGIRIGTNRKRIVADAIACVVIIFLEFPKYRKQFVSFFAVVVFVFVASTSVFRGATESFGSLMGDLFEAGSLQSYLCGQYNVAAALETENLFGEYINFGTFVYSTFRSFFGIGTLIGGMDIPTLHDYFNVVASSNYTYLRESQIIPTIGEGAIYFGQIASPLISLFVVVVGIQIDKLFKKSTRVEVVFILVVLAVYLGQGLVLTSNIIVNNLTFKLALFAPIVFIANYLKDESRNRR